VFYVMRDFAGEPLWCFADITVEGRPAGRADVREATEPLGPVVGDRIAATFGFGNAVTGYFASARSPEGNGGRWGLDLLGSRGMVSIRLDTQEPVHVLLDPSWSPGGKAARWEALPGAPDAPTQPDALHRNLPITADLLEAIRDDRLPRVSLQDGHAALEMHQAVYESYVAGRRVRFPLERRDHPLTRWA